MPRGAQSGGRLAHSRVPHSDALQEHNDAAALCTAGAMRRGTAMYRPAVSVYGEYTPTRRAKAGTRRQGPLWPRALGFWIRMRQVPHRVIPPELRGHGKQENGSTLGQAIALPRDPRGGRGTGGRTWRSFQRSTHARPCLRTPPPLAQARPQSQTSRQNGGSTPTPRR